MSDGATSSDSGYRIKTTSGDVTITGQPMLWPADLIELARRAFGWASDAWYELRDSDGALVKGDGVIAWGLYYVTQEQPVDA